MVKLAAARAHYSLGELSHEKAEAIFAACKDIIDGQYHDNFIVDMIQGGAGTSTNMNMNEVISNIALDNMGEPLGNYSKLHPNNDVNRSQSTNDVYPTSVKLAVLLSCQALHNHLTTLIESLESKAKHFSGILKMGRTQLQDAVPMTIGQEFNSWAHTLINDQDKLAKSLEAMQEVNLGGTAIGTGINTSQGYGITAINELSNISQYNFVQSPNLIEASSDTSGFVLISSMLKRLAIKLSKICNDLRLLSMGPRTGIAEINLPPMQPGSSIMPGKVNPVIPEAVNQVAYQVIGNDLTITMAAEAGQLQLNAMEPIIAAKLLESIEILSNAVTMLDQKCIRGITINKEHCEFMVNNSIGIITAINPYIGYENAARIARQALANNCSVVELIKAEGLMSEEQLSMVLAPQNMVGSQL